MKRKKLEKKKKIKPRRKLKKPTLKSKPKRINKARLDFDNPYFVPLNTPTKLNMRLQAWMVHYLSVMIPIRDACHLLGLFEATHYRWIQLGREFIQSREENWKDKPAEKNFKYAKYFQAVQQASAQMRQRVIARSLNTNKYKIGWTRDITILERRDRGNWGKQLEISNQETEMDPDESFL